jgi:hypothetical protein
MIDAVSYGFGMRKERAHLFALEVDAYPVPNPKFPPMWKVDGGCDDRNLVDHNGYRLERPTLQDNSLCPANVVLRIVGSRPGDTLWANKHDHSARGQATKSGAPAD